MAFPTPKCIPQETNNRFIIFKKSLHIPHLDTTSTLHPEKQEMARSTQQQINLHFRKDIKAICDPKVELLVDKKWIYRDVARLVCGG
jgi:hypothetical protein